jgi:hypothetical protein
VIGPPTVVVVSGGVWLNGGAPEDKLHLHWRLARPARGEDALARLKKARRLATGLAGGDTSNIPMCHPIRWPGSWHRKAEPRLCKIEQLNPDIEIDLDAALAALAAAAPPEAQQSSGSIDSSNGADGGEKWDTLLADIASGKRYHYPLTALAARCVGAGMHDGQTVNLLRGLMAASTAPRDERWQARFDEIPRIVSTARAKFSKPQQPNPSTVPLPFINMSSWDTTPVPDRKWSVRDRIPARQPSLFSGDRRWPAPSRRAAPTMQSL